MDDRTLGYIRSSTPASGSLIQAITSHNDTKLKAMQPSLNIPKLMNNDTMFKAMQPSLNIPKLVGNDTLLKAMQPVLMMNQIDRLRIITELRGDSDLMSNSGDDGFSRTMGKSHVRLLDALQNTKTSILHIISRCSIETFGGCAVSFVEMVAPVDQGKEIGRDCEFFIKRIRDRDHCRLLTVLFISGRCVFFLWAASRAKLTDLAPARSKNK